LKLAAIRHRIVDGDTLEQLSQRYLGCRERAAEIYEVNQSLLKSPDVLPIGVELTIPLGKTSEAENQGGPSSNTDTSPSGITDLVPLRRDELEELKSRSE
jgi:phage tail protein X